MEFNVRQKNIIAANDKNILCLACAAAGKAIPTDTIIPTPNGAKKAGNIQIGDLLFDRNGNSTKVIGVYPQGQKQVYRLTFGDGRTAKCCNEHLWSIHKATWKDKNQFKTMSVNELLKEKLINSSRSAQFYIPVAKAVQYSTKKYTIPPYVIGAFLGDGCTMQNTYLTLSSENNEIPNHVLELLEGDSLYQNPANFNWNFIKNGQKLSTNILPSEVCQYSYNKTIPQEYKYGDIEQRLELLRGLMDTDGSITKDSRDNHKNTAIIRFASTSLQLIKDVQEVLGSLGYISSISEDNRPEKYTYKTCYNLIVSMPNSEKYKLFWLPRKKEIALLIKDMPQHRDYTRTSIRKIEDLGYQTEMVCFEVENSEHLFLMNDFIVTHNTRTLIGRIERLLDEGIAPSSIVAFTFTNQAAEEMRKRLGNKCGDMFIGTIHSYANKICSIGNIDTYDYIRTERFDKIIEKAMTVPWEKYPAVKYLFVDEFQDTDPIQYSFITRIPAENRFYVGDERQFIYSFRGATDRFIRELATDDNFKKYPLVDNYRNPPNILRFADEFLNSMPKISPCAVPAKIKSGFLDECSFRDAAEEMTWTEDWTGWTVLCRTNSEVETAQEYLDSKNVRNLIVKRGDLDLDQMGGLLNRNAVKIMTVHACVTGDTIVPTSNGLMTIQELVNKNDYNIKVFNGEYYDSVNKFIKNPKQKILKITTNFGNQIKVSEDHDVIILTDNGHKKIKAKDLCGNEEILIKHGIKDYLYSNEDLVVPKKEEFDARTVIYNVPNKLDRELAELIGMITADGTYNEKSIHYIKHYKECVDRFAELIYFCFNKKIEVKQCSDRDSWYAECNSVYILNFLKQNFDGITPLHKKVSSTIMRSSNENQCAFLRGFFEDGTVSLKEGNVDNVCLTFKNDEMRPQLQSLMSAIGIPTSFIKRTYQKKTLNYIYIYSTGLETFRDKIGFITNAKQDRLNSYTQKYDRRNKSAAFKNIMLNNKEDLYINGNSRFWNNMTKQEGMGREGFFKYYEKLSDEQKKNNNIVYIKNIFEEYEVEKISLIEVCEDEETYCLTMEHEAQFLQNGFLMGNCKGLEFDNVVVMGCKTFNEEERRICYVAATRAMQSLYWCPSIRTYRGKAKNKSHLAGNVFSKTERKTIQF